MISLIIPTLNEEKNITILLSSINKNLKDIQHEIIIVDDNSSDNTKNEALKFKKANKGHNIHFFIHHGKKDLSKSIVLGIEKSKGNIIIVMDADLSHPTNKLMKMINLIRYNHADIVVGCRDYVEKWEIHRKFISKLGTLLAKPLTNIRDPLSGFFAFRKDILTNKILNPLGYKILLEIIVKSDYKKIIEIGYIFKNRESGKSKLNTKIMFYYLIHLTKLYNYLFLKKIKSCLR